MKSEKKIESYSVVLTLSIEELHMLRVFARTSANNSSLATADAAARFIDATNHFDNPGFHPAATFIK
jgi:hypothetical protein